MKKRILVFLIGMVFMSGFVGSSNALLYSRAGGTMVYDDDLDITWLADANYAMTSGHDADGRMQWNSAMTWADNLVFGGYDDWRLPDTVQPDPSCSIQVSGDSLGYNCTGSEMGHLFYDELGGTAGSSILTSGDPDLALFSNLQPNGYWSGTGYAPDPIGAWEFGFNHGYQNVLPKDWDYYAWAVRSGDVSAPVPEPSTMLLLGSGIAGLAAWRKRQGRDIG